MKYIKDIDWSLLWSITKDIILPHTGTLILNSILFLIIGLFLSIIYAVILHKKGVLKRKPKYYNWLVKLYIPIIIGLFMYIFGQIGFLRGVYKIIDKEKAIVVNGLYDVSIDYTFDSEESKNDFIKRLQEAAKEARTGSNYLSDILKISAVNYNTGNSVIDAGKNKLSLYLIDEYGDEIYTTGMYAMLNVAGAKAHININEALPYNEFSSAMEILLDVGYNDIEIAVKDKLTNWFSTMLESQYKSMVKSLCFLLLIIMAFPLLEFFIYTRYMKAQNKDKKA
ncbi:hypothetical protein [Cellulophaga fucicola]|uniref:Uncharacterized protein n=1 Tax=Cellulophaga fucicola TaxID=76595 RepID=A0A1K1QK87_9FLAO|nr:hypothetical protein [Cellulophaga fucicola]SFW60352.1 hypothetical protein SAMN05660313_02732 [Cellulophaga fucicola]